MTITEAELPGGNGESEVIRWRRAELRRAGYGEAAAGELAGGQTSISIARWTSCVQAVRPSSPTGSSPDLPRAYVQRSEEMPPCPHSTRSARLNGGPGAISAAVNPATP